jgi:hypothetical protein
MCPQDVIFGGHRRGHSQIHALQRAKDGVQLTTCSGCPGGVT